MENEETHTMELTKRQAACLFRAFALTGLVINGDGWAPPVRQVADLIVDMTDYDLVKSISEQINSVLSAFGVPDAR
jgi:hypothetical protein